MTGKTVEIAIVRHTANRGERGKPLRRRGDSKITEFGREQLIALTMAMEAWKRRRSSARR